MGPGDLQDVLGDLRHEEHADLLVGLGRSDDAAVYRVTDDVAIVETVDFFPPIVDDPYLYGAIAAANSMSDVYAMGGQVLFALNVAGFPRDLPKAIIAAVFRGGADKVREAGGVIAVAQEAGAGGATDITGFGLLGHASEMVEASGAGLTLRGRDLPLLPGALALAERGTFSGGMGRNRSYLEDALGARGRLRIDPAVPEALVKLLCASETSGGLLFAVDTGQVATVRDGFARRGEPVWEVGVVTAGPGLALV